MNISMIGSRQMYSNQQKALPGFTFMEMIIVVALFSVLTMATSDIFMRTVTTQRKTAALQRLQDDVRYLTQKVTAELQAGSLEYSAYENARECNAGTASSIKPVQGNAILAIRRFDGTHLYITKSDSVCVNEQSTPCLAISEDGTTWTSASSRNVTIDSLLFYISPDKDPFIYCDSSSAYLRNSQPRVTINVTASASVTAGKEPVHLSLQTTIASREYKR